MMWVDTTLAGLLSGVQNMVGTERFLLALQAEGRRSVEADWQVISQFADFRDGFAAIANIAAVAGWGNWELSRLDAADRECRFRATDSWEGCYQRALGVCWGSGMLAGKLAGYCSRLFGTNCWAEQTAYIVKGDGCDEFVVKPSPKLIETEIENLLRSDGATRADMAVALRRLEAEVARRTRVEEVLRAGEAQYRALVETTGTGFVIIDTEGRVMDANREYVRMTGHARAEDILGRKVLEWTAPHHVDRNSQAVAQCARTGTIRGLEIDYVDSRSRVTPVEINATTVEGGGAPRILTLVRDIGAYRRTEETLRTAHSEVRRSLAFTEALLSAIPTPVFFKDAEGRYLGCNRAFTEQLGLTADRIKGKTVGDLWPGEYAAAYHAKDLELMQAPRQQTYEYRVRDRHGEDRDVIYARDVFRDETGRVAGIVGAYVDITDRKRTEMALRINDARLRSVVESTADGLLVVDGSGKVIVCNSRFGELWRIPRTVLEAGDDNAMLAHVLDQITAPEAFLAKVRALYVSAAEDMDEIHFKDGRVFERYSRPLILQGAVTGRVWSFRDITDRKRAEGERERLISELEARNAELERFTYTVSHDLRSPLITIRGFLDSVADSARTGDAARLHADIGRIAAATDRMERLLHELLALSRIGRVANPSGPVPLEEVVREAAEQVGGGLASGEIVLEIARGMPPVYGDRQRLLEAMQNLLENAVKFMGGQPHPRIEVGMRPGSAQSPPVFFVRDNGVGIAPEYHEKIFGLFDKLNPEAEGTGIGLALVKRIVSVHGGNIWVESEGAGRGSSFCLTLPLAGKTQERDR
jgi:PAS domain S-box-containing protein